MRITFFLPILALPACVSFSGGQDYTVVCPYDTVWEATSEAMQGFSVTSENKNNGTIETAWVEMEGERRPYGLFSREGFGNRERARLTVAIKKDNDVSSVNILETRQRWHARGGATQQATRWWPIEPSEEVLDEITAKLSDRLKEKGCEVPR